MSFLIIQHFFFKRLDMFSLAAINCHNKIVFSYNSLMKSLISICMSFHTHISDHHIKFQSRTTKVCYLIYMVYTSLVIKLCFIQGWYLIKYFGPNCFWNSPYLQLNNLNFPVYFTSLFMDINDLSLKHVEQRIVMY